MALTKKEVEELKEQLKQQVQDLPEDKKQEAFKQVDEMSAQALELMLSQQQQKSIYRMIVNKEVPSTIIEENSDAIVVLDINPISKGHTLIVPKIPAPNIKAIPKKIIDLAQELGKKITENLKAKSAQILPQENFGEAVIHILPIYDKPLSLDSKRSKATPEQLKETAQEISLVVIKKKIPVIKKKKKKKVKPLKLEKRIP